MLNTNYLECPGCLGHGPATETKAEIYALKGRLRVTTHSNSSGEHTYPLFGVTTRPVFSFHPVKERRKNKNSEFLRQNNQVRKLGVFRK